MAEQLDKDPISSGQEGHIDAARLNQLFHQITHDIRVPVTGLKMLWPMINEVSEEERDEVFGYLKSSSYELFDLIENLTQLMIDFELLTIPPDYYNPTDLIMEAIRAIEEGNLDVDLECADARWLLRPQHFNKCLEVTHQLLQQLTEDLQDPVVTIACNCSDEACVVRFIGPSIHDASDQYSAEIHYSLFNRAKGNSKLSGFLLLQLRNLMGMVGGSLNIVATDEKTEFALIFPDA